ncbi:MAG: hypothetical protein GX913_08960 [Clostridiales bacterium]|nr:hypothetical protein [Clostridiales bacterium]
MKKVRFYFVILFYIIIVFAINVQNIYAFDYYQEVLKFDEEGNLIMTTHDGKAKYPTTYGTLGWTIKRYDLPIDDPQNICVTIILEDGGYIDDPNNSDYVYSYFYCDKNTIFNRIGEVSLEWQKHLYESGDTVYLDGVMTVYENGISQGMLKDNGRSHSGEVYYTYEGILGARGWGAVSRESLRTHFNKRVSFPPVEGMIPEDIPEDEENTEKEYVYYNYDESGLKVSLEASLESYDYRVTQGIPTGEELYATGEMTTYGYRCIYKKTEGKKEYSVEVSTSYNLVWTNDLGQDESESYEDSSYYIVERPYTYWEVEELKLYYPSQLTINNNTLDGGSVTLNTEYIPDIIIKGNMDTSYHIIEPEYLEVISLDGGTIDGGSERPSVPEGDYLGYAEDAVREIIVKNDYFSIDGEVLLDDSEGIIATTRPNKSTMKAPITVYEDGLFISHSKENGSYSSSGTVGYKGYFFNSSGSSVTKSVPSINSVVVHTPTICIGSVSDGKRFNQLVFPDMDKPSLILGEPFTVSVSLYGSHREIKSFGTRDYFNHTKDIQVKFPFEVICDNKRIIPESWISMGREKTFILPVEVNEGVYDIAYRTLADNIDAPSNGRDKTEKYANLNRENYVATDFISVEVMGRLYDFKVTDIIDYPRWEGIFQTPIALAENIKGYNVGNRNKNGILQNISPIFTLPILSGSNPVNPKSGAIKTGYHFKYEVNTIGNFYDEGDSIFIEPIFHYVNHKGENRQEVDLYYCETIVENYTHLISLGQEVHLYPGNRKLSNESYAIQTWFGDYYLPQKAHAIKKGTKLPSHGIDKNTWLSEGYLIVNFKIWAVNEGKKRLDYINKDNELLGFCNMWKTEGFSYTKQDLEGNLFYLRDGDVIFYDTDKSLLGDYKIMGTH